MKKVINTLLSSLICWALNALLRHSTVVLQAESADTRDSAHAGKIIIGRRSKCHVIYGASLLDDDERQ